MMFAYSCPPVKVVSPPPGAPVSVAEVLAEPNRNIAPINRRAAAIEMFTGVIILRVKVMIITAAMATKV